MSCRVLPALALALLFAWAPSALGLSHSRTYQWGFPNGTYVSNWSFENPMDFWSAHLVSGLTANLRLKGQGSDAGGARSGAYIAQAKTTGAYTGSNHSLLRSQAFRIPGGLPYTLSFYYKTHGTFSGTVRPEVTVLTGTSSTESVLSGPSFTAATNWTLYTFAFTPPAETQILRLHLAEFISGSTASLFFDDVILEPGNLTSAQVLSNRRKITASLTLGDALGRSHQTHTGIDTLGQRFLVGGTGYDDFARPETTYLPTPFTGVDLNPNSSLLNGARGHYNAGGPYDTHGYPFSRVRYAEEPGGRVVEASTPDSAWQFGKGHTRRSDQYCVNTTDVPPNIENPPLLNAACTYSLAWSKDPDSSYSLTYTDKLGQVRRVLRNVTRSASPANTWKWAATLYEYHPSGKLKRVITPLDDSAGTTHFAEYSQYDAQGRLISQFSPDRGLRKFWYNRLGQLRYSQDPVQKSQGAYAYFEYDTQGRPLSQGIHTVGSLPQDSVDKDVYGQGIKVEKVGYIYDDTATFAARTGFTLSEIMGYAKSYIYPEHLNGRLFCKYNRNHDNALAGFTPRDKFVADIFAYDQKGRLATQWKFLGPIRDPAMQLQDVWFIYDALDRLKGYTHYENALSGTMSSVQTYTYDFLGRVEAITGEGAKPLARYLYTEEGPLDEVELGGLPSGDSTLIMSYAYNSQGAVKEISATAAYNFGASNKRVFQQFLGFEAKAYSAAGVPNPLQSKYGGSITQQVYKYTSDLNDLKPVRAVNYAYDHLGRMGAARGYMNSNGTPLTSTEDINGWTLAMAPAEALSTTMDYDLNGRIKGQRSAGASATDSARYIYAPNSYRLDRVTGKVSGTSTRNMAATGTFVYDANGAMVEDKSKRMKVAYGWDGLPASFTVEIPAAAATARCCLYDGDAMPWHHKARNPSRVLHNFYDADGNRVSRMEVEGQPDLKLEGTYYLYFAPGMLREQGEIFSQDGRIAATRSWASIMGQGSQIGRIGADGRHEFFVKNHLGSTMLTVDDRGRYSDGRAQDYLAYGSHRDLKSNGSDPVTQKFTGKEFEALTRLYAFGWRWHDPELGMWMSPDPVEEFINPYSYVGGDVVNSVDPNGLVKLGVGVVFGWNRRDGFSIGLGVAADDINLGLVEYNTDLSHSWNQNGSQTTTFQVGGSACVGLCAGGQAGGSYNTEAGYSASLSGNVGVGLTTLLQTGGEAGTNHYWTTGRDYIGGDIFGGAYAQAVGRVSAGYSYGLGAIESGFYARASILGLSGGYHSAQGWNTGFSGSFNVIELAGKSEAQVMVEQAAARIAAEQNGTQVACGPCIVAAAPVVAAAVSRVAVRFNPLIVNASSLMNRLFLGKQLASDAQLGEKGMRIIGAGTHKTLLDAGRLAREYGGQASDWAKMTSSSFRSASGFRFETHWYENVATGMRVEYKTKLLGY